MWEAGPGGRHLIADALLAYALSRHLPGAAVAGTAGVLDGALAQAGASPDQLASARRCGALQRAALENGRMLQWAACAWDLTCMGMLQRSLLVATVCPAML